MAPGTPGSWTTLTHIDDGCKLNAPMRDACDSCDFVGDQRPGCHMVTCSSISVTRAAIGDRSDRVSVTCANSG